MTAKELDLPSLHERAQALAELAHYGQLDKADRPYIEHPQRVAAYAVELIPEFERWQGVLMDPVRAVTVALLHDTVEDTWVTLEILGRLFPAEICQDVMALTRLVWDEEGYYPGILKAASLYPLLVKIADLRDNTDADRLALLPAPKRKRLAEKYTEAAKALGLMTASPFKSYFYHLTDYLEDGNLYE